MSPSHISALIAALDASDQSTSTQNPVVEKFADSAESNVGPSKGRKTAWNVPSNKALQEVEYPVICGDTWPSLTANTSSRSSHKSSSIASSSSSNDLMSLSDVSIVSVPSETTVAVPMRQQPGQNLNSSLIRQGSTDSENTHGHQTSNKSSRWVHSQNCCGYNNNKNHHHHHHNNNNSGRGSRGYGRGSADWNPSWNNSPRSPYFYQENQAMTTPQPHPTVSYGYDISIIYPTYYTPTGYDYSHAMYGHVPLTVPQSVTPIVPGYAKVLELRNSILKQIDYYFSIENLIKDTYLRKKMDGQGWVPIFVVANFKRVKQMSSDLQFILESLNDSIVVEVQGNKIRRRKNWMTWILPPTLQVETVANQLRDLTVGFATANSNRNI